MVTAVALPKIILDFSSNSPEPPSPSSGGPRGSSTATCSPTSSRCRWRAAWPTSGAPGGCSSAALVAVRRRVAARRPRPRRSTSSSPAASSRALGGGILVPVGTAAASHLFEGHARPRALGVIGALTFLGMAAGPFVGAAILGGLNVEGALASLGAAPGTALHDAARAGVALGLLHQRPDRDRRPARRLGGVGRLGDAAPERRRSTSSARPSGRVALGGGLGRRDAPRQPATSAGLDPRARQRRCSAAVAVVATILTIVRGFAPAGPVPRSAAVHEPHVLVGGARLAAHRLRLRDRDHRRGGVRRPRPLRRPRAAAGRARGARRRRRPSGRSCRGSRSATCRCGS